MPYSLVTLHIKFERNQPSGSQDHGSKSCPNFFIFFFFFFFVELIKNNLPLLLAINSNKWEPLLQLVYNETKCKYILVKPNPNQNTLAVKKLWPRPEKSCDEKDVKSKGGGQGMLLITLKILIMMTWGCNFFTTRVFWVGILLLF